MVVLNIFSSVMCAQPCCSHTWLPLLASGSCRPVSAVSARYTLWAALPRNARYPRLAWLLLDGEDCPHLHQQHDTQQHSDSAHLLKLHAFTTYIHTCLIKGFQGYYNANSMVRYWHYNNHVIIK